MIADDPPGNLKVAVNDLALREFAIRSIPLRYMHAGRKNAVRRQSCIGSGKASFADTSLNDLTEPVFVHVAKLTSMLEVLWRKAPKPVVDDDASGSILDMIPKVALNECLEALWDSAIDDSLAICL